MRASRLPFETGKAPPSKKLPPCLSSFLSFLSRPLPLSPSPIPSSLRHRLGSRALKRLAVTPYETRGEKQAESSLALEGAFNWIRLIRLKSPLLYRKGHLNSTGAIILVPFSRDRPGATRLFSLPFPRRSPSVEKRLASRPAYFRSLFAGGSFARSDTVLRRESARGTLCVARL